MQTVNYKKSYSSCTDKESDPGPFAWNEATKIPGLKMPEVCIKTDV